MGQTCCKDFSLNNQNQSQKIQVNDQFVNGHNQHGNEMLSTSNMNKENSQQNNNQQGEEYAINNKYENNENKENKNNYIEKQINSQNNQMEYISGPQLKQDVPSTQQNNLTEENNYNNINNLHQNYSNLDNKSISQNQQNINQNAHISSNFQAAQMSQLQNQSLNNVQNQSQLDFQQQQIQFEINAFYQLYDSLLNQQRSKYEEGNQINFLLKKTKYLNSENIHELEKGIIFETNESQQGEILQSDISFQGKGGDEILLMEINVNFEEEQQIIGLKNQINNSNNKNQQEQKIKKGINIGIIKDGQQDIWKPVGRYGCHINLLDFNSGSQMELKKELTSKQYDELSITNNERVLLIYNCKTGGFQVLARNSCVRFVSAPKKFTMNKEKLRFVIVVENVKCQVKLLHSY
ncbi:hypothetical protein PPERSA_08712 [Pseudocohnilembus persalinus]|uniref:Uncharacterized protein n=1 Tax=Pseudocohnilembus persalinus TaxID=266149 RepID=A0A0V0QXQ1_PSEPJ|nr:hypothetical protein PPERSA_08712 [Pseudocohnilembus persalinus]|eukprot:KRX07035.1 hypothetical protein PPERSA_08712 [Pseudocohnilembus persalinus]